jgi:hypothetical protein
MGEQDPLAVKPGLIVNLVLLSADASPVHLEVLLAVSFVADMALRIGFGLLLEGFHDGLPIKGPFAGLARIEADDVSLAIEYNLLDFERRRVLDDRAFRSNLPVAARVGKHLVFDLLDLAPAGA